MTYSCMLISKNWLRDFVFLPDALDAQALAKQLCLSTVEVEKIINQADAFANLVVGQIKKIEIHPNADKLKVCSVDVGDEMLPIVCGGSNIKEGMKVIVAKLGASVRWHGEGEPIFMERATIRGVESMGMICASDEIGLLDRFPKNDEKEIVDLSKLKIKVGQSLASALGLDDVIFDIDNKSLSNRPDLWGHYGMAREVAALTGKKFKEMNPPKIKAGKDYKISVDVQASDLCPRYMAVGVSGLSAVASPEWLARRLESAGLRSINAIVDVTNYVMLELGQPLHAFDADELHKKSIVVRRAKVGEKFVTLDDKEYSLNNEMLVIADDERALAIAGVMGGKNSGVTESTTTVVFEAATFDAGSIRRTSNVLGLRTDSSSRFEKSLDPNLPEIAVRRVVELAKKIFPKAQVASNVADVKLFSEKIKVLELSVSFVNERLGLSLDHKTMLDILTRLGFGVKIKKKLLQVTIPTWRATKDITIAEDIVEEIARMHGYDKIPATLPKFTINPPEENVARTLEREIKELLVFEVGLTETSNYSFVAPEWINRLGLNLENYLSLDNPIAKDRPWLRRDLFPGLLENIDHNGREFDRVRLFEIGRVFRSEESGERAQPNSNELLPQQPLHLGIAISEAENVEPFFAASHTLEVLGKRLGFQFKLTPPSAPIELLHPGRQAVVMIGEAVVGMIGELHPRLQQSLGIHHRVALVEISIQDLVSIPRESFKYTSLPEFPSVGRDMAIIVDQSILHADIVAAVLSSDPLVVKVELFDTYAGKHIPDGKKSLAYHITYQATDRTLTTENADALQKEVEIILKKKLSAILR